LMKAPHSTSSCPEMRIRLSIDKLSFGSKGPYSLTCCSSECIGVSGASGVGKTLFLRAVADLDPHSGDVALDGKSADEFWAPEWRRRVALVPAESRWWHNDVRSHLPSGVKLADIIGLLESLGFTADVLDWEVSRLSTGEKQRLSVARALLRVPSVLLLDEIGSGLDHENIILLESTVRRYQLHNKCPIIWVSHDRRQLERVCDRLVILKEDQLELDTFFSINTGKQQ